MIKTENDGKHRSSRTTAKKVEALLWLQLVLLVFVHRQNTSWIQYLTLFQSILETVTGNFHRQGNSIWRPCEDQGDLMNAVLIACLLQSAASYDESFDIPAKCLAILVFADKRIAIPMIGIAMIADEEFRSLESILLALIWCVCENYFSRLHRRILTRGEFYVLNSFSAIVILEWIKTTILPIETPLSISHNFVALSGVLGCGLTCLTLIQFKLPWWQRLFYHITGPLILVEASLWRRDCVSGFSAYLPRSLTWLLNFLQSSENGYPRYWGLSYWAVTLFLSLLPTKIVLENNLLSVVIRRKWFHLLAVCLFGPITFLMPQLMSLSYAVALCGLVILEELRQQSPLLQSFYINFVDPTKDNPLLLVSHIFLVLGCAMPLWIAEYDLIGDEKKQVLAQWGVLCLGVGDTAGAVIGSKFGKIRWGQNRRTIEGSLAVWSSMFGLVLVMCPQKTVVAMIVPLTLTTLLEAFTLQMDNLVLPIAGSVCLLLLMT